MSRPAIEIESLSLRYGSTRALEGLSLTVPEGAVYALLGRNGAGKSSLVRCLLGHRKPANGSRVRVLGLDPWRKRVDSMRQIGVVPESPEIPSRMTALALGKLIERVRPAAETDDFRERLVSLRVPLEAPFGTLSRGQQSQVCLQAALVGRPRLLICDDPTLGLDPVARKLLLEELIVDLADRGTTVLVTTHDLGGIEPIADRVGILIDGELVLDDRLEAVRGRFRKTRQPSGSEPWRHRDFRTFTEATGPLGTEVVIELAEGQEPPQGLEWLPMSLEEIFLAIVHHRDSSNEERTS